MQPDAWQGRAWLLRRATVGVAKMAPKGVCAAVVWRAPFLSTSACSYVDPRRQRARRRLLRAVWGMDAPARLPGVAWGGVQGLHRVAWECLSDRPDLALLLIYRCRASRAECARERRCRNGQALWVWREPSGCIAGCAPEVGLRWICWAAGAFATTNCAGCPEGSGLHPGRRAPPQLHEEQECCKPIIRRTTYNTGNRTV